MILQQPVRRAAPTCVWMDAGVLSYRLCERGFDCEHCPLDAALRGAALRPQAPDADGARAAQFPNDRRYSRNHLWLQPVGRAAQRVRLGLDDFATCLLAAARGVRCTEARGALRPGDVLCRIELEPGALALGVPIEARVTRANPALHGDPRPALTAPYGEGWIVELAPARPGELDGLLDAEAARRQARLDWRRFRRLAGMHLLLDRDGRAGAPHRPPDLCKALGGPCYLALVRELLH